MGIQYCLMPKRIFKVGKMIRKDGTEGTETLYRSYDTEYVYQREGAWHDVSCRDPHKSRIVLKYHALKGIVVPCGICHYCRLRKAYDRAKQAWCDSRYYKFQYFITLTYDDESLHFQNFVDADGVIQTLPVLSKDDARQFKEVLRDRARKRGYQNIEYMMSGEYGERNGRPHYHMILLTDDPEIELSLYAAGRTKTGYDLYGSIALDEIWQKGLIKLSRASTACMAYTARYTLKKSYKGDYDKLRKQFCDFPEEFISSTPGIGKRYLDEHLEEILKKPTLQLPGTKGVSLPSYFIDRLEKLGYSDFVKKLKDDNIDRQNKSIRQLEKDEKMRYDEFVKHQQFRRTKRQYEM